jgi:hypothetical protein
MKIYLVLLIFLFSKYHSYAQYGKLVFSFSVSDPWADVIGADVPLFALYEKGDVLYSKKIGGELKIYHEVKTKEEKENLVLDFSLNEKANRGFLNHYTELTGYTDQPSNIFYINTDSVYSIIIYGNMEDDSLVKAAMQQSKTVDIFEGVRKEIINYNSKTAEEWLPDKIEVMLWDYSHSSSTGIAWPKEWPGLEDKATVSRGDDLYSIYIDKKDIKKLKNYMQKVNEDGGNTVLLNKKKWAISYRLPFPGIK